MDITSNYTPWTPVYINIHQDQYSVLALVLTSIASLLSICGAIVIFISYRLVQQARNTTRRLLLYLTVADFIMAISTLTGTIRYAVKYGNKDRIEVICPEQCDYFCLIHGFIQTWANLSSFFWTTIIAFNLLFTVIRNCQQSILAGLFSHIIAWIIPLVVVTSAAASGAIGEDYRVGSGLWCWITACFDSALDQLFWLLFTSKGWELMMYLLTGASYILLKQTVIRRRRVQPDLRYNDISPQLRSSDENYLVLWLVIYVLRIWGTIRFFMAYYRNSTDSRIDGYETVDQVFFYFQCVGDTSQALFSCILFCGLDCEVRHSIFSYFRRRAYQPLEPVVQ